MTTPGPAVSARPASHVRGGWCRGRQARAGVVRGERQPGSPIRPSRGLAVALAGASARAAGVPGEVRGLRATERGQRRVAGTDGGHSRGPWGVVAVCDVDCDLTHRGLDVYAIFRTDTYGRARMPSIRARPAKPLRIQGLAGNHDQR